MQVQGLLLSGDENIVLVPGPASKGGIMSDRAAFLRAIREAPHDETLRLVFADWLEEHRDPLGEFVRVHCALEALPDRFAGGRAEELRQREEELLHEHQAEWLGPLADMAGNWPYQTPYRLRRGLVEAVCLPVQTFLDRGAELLAWCPAMSELTLLEVRGQGAELARAPHLAEVVCLELADWPTEDDAQALARSPHVGRLRALQLWLGGRHEEALCRAFTRSPGLRELREMRLVQILGGLAAGEQAKELAARANERAAEANRYQDREIARVVRPFERHFPLREDLGHKVYAGRLPGNRQGMVVLYAGQDRDGMDLAVFDADGRLLEVLRRNIAHLQVRRRRGTYIDVDRDGLLEFLSREFGFELALAHAREFVTEGGLVVQLWPGHYAEELANPDEIHPYSSEGDWRTLGGQLYTWLERGNFVIEWGNDYWAGPDGQIHSS
jgi:uncharacterized protein (TIGR02996 family)